MQRPGSRVRRAHGFALAAGCGVALALAGCTSAPSGAPATPTAAAPSPSASAPASATPTATVTAAAPGATPTAPATGAAQYRDGTYEIAGRPVTLVNGLSEVAAAPGSASMVTTRYFGNEATGDLNGDGTPDVAFLLTQSTGGSGTFFYVVVALGTSSGYAGTNGVLLGDRVAPQPTTIQGAVVTVNYAERRPGEPMTTRPSMGVSKYLRIENGQLVEVPASPAGAAEDSGGC